MFAAKIPTPGQITLVDVPEPQLEPRDPDDAGTGDIIFQPELACLCGSDMLYFESFYPEYPPVIGHSLHEMIGTVVATNGRKFRPGERVLCVPVNQEGFFERYRISETRAIPLDTRKPEDETLLAQPLGTVIFALRKLPNLINWNVAVVGQGPIGQMFNACLRNLGANEIIGLDALDSRLKSSPQTGATATVNVQREDPLEGVRKILGGKLPDLVIEAVGHRDHALNLCINLCKHAGHLLFFGVPTERIDSIEWRALFMKNVTVVTSVNPDFGVDFPLAMRWISEGRINLRPVITHRYPLSEVQKAYEVFRDRTDGALKVFLDFPAGKK